MKCIKKKAGDSWRRFFQECLALESADQNIPFARHLSLVLHYKGRVPKQIYQPDFICFEKIILEIKAVSALADEHRAQVHNYLRATGYRLGLLVNFGHFLKVQSECIVL